ncbi:MAG: hypothetical protein ACD_75C01726G0003 [uncultured bacterium]|nr:MAG: hypothetical protein ACD_75C01726G0003 [uncultured bacterium]
MQNLILGWYNNKSIVHIENIHDAKKIFRLHLLKFQIVKHKQLILIQSCTQCHAQSEFSNFLSQFESIITRFWSKNNTTTSPERRPLASCTRSTRSFLAPRFCCAAAADLNASLSACIACPPARPLHANNIMNQMRIDCHVENIIAQLNFPHFFILYVCYLCYGHLPAPP